MSGSFLISVIVLELIGPLPKEFYGQIKRVQHKIFVQL